MSRYGGAAALVVVLSLTIAPSAAADDQGSATNETKAGDARGKKCATRKEFRQIDVKGKRTSTLRQVRKIIDSNGKRDRISHAEGHKWEIRTYRHCGSRIRHVYVNYRDNSAYYKTGRP